MKKYLILLLLIIPFSTFAQSKDDLLKEIISLRYNNDYLKLDTIKLRLKIHDINRYSNYEIKRQQWVIDSLRWAYKKLERERDSLISFKKNIFETSKTTILLYYKEGDESLYYINLSCYELIQKGDKIIFKPITDRSKWRKPKIYGYPQPDNLSLHLYPYNLKGNTLKN